MQPVQWKRGRIVWVMCLGGLVVATAGCQLPRGYKPGPGEPSSELLGTRYTRVSMSWLQTGNPAIEEIDDFMLALSVDFNLPISKTLDLQGFLGNRKASGEAVDAVFGPYEMSVGGQYFGVGLTGHSRPDEVLDPYIFVAAQYLLLDVDYRDTSGSVVFDEEDFGWVAGGGIEWRPTASVAASPYIKYFDNGIFGEGTRIGGRIDTWLDDTWFLELSGEAPISQSGHALGLGLGFRF